MIKYPPIALFTYDRPAHTRLVIQALLKNPEAQKHDLIIFSDAARELDREEAVKEVRDYLSTVNGFRSIVIHHRPHNYGLSRSIITGVTQVLAENECVIVIEDDIVVSIHFLGYMNDALERYAKDDRVICVHGYTYPVNEPLPEAFFLRGADCWGWATWRRGWNLFNHNGRFLLNELTRRKLLKAFDFNGAYNYSGMLEDNIRGKNDSWAVRWYASAFLANKLTLYPGRSLVHNIGNDSSGTHCGESIKWDVQLADRPIILNEIKVEVSNTAQEAVERFFCDIKPPLKRLLAILLMSLSRLVKQYD